jgi:ubiquinone/menaquinone biosynthesis C-methylase UbiE
MKPRFIALQSSRPSGVLGNIIATIMGVETSRENRIAVSLLELQSADRVLEIGFGHGRTLAMLAKAVPQGHVAGFDVSDTMLAMASRRNRRHISAGRMALHLGTVEQLPFGAASFDKVMAVHCVYFWPDPARALAEIRRVLRASGRLVLGFKEKDMGAGSEAHRDIYRFHSAAEIEQLCSEAGFATITTVQPRQETRGTTLLVASVASA